jgi:hypothetical protein
MIRIVPASNLFLDFLGEQRPLLPHNPEAPRLRRRRAGPVAA